MLVVHPREKEAGPPRCLGFEFCPLKIIRGPRAAQRAAAVLSSPKTGRFRRRGTGKPAPRPGKLFVPIFCQPTQSCCFTMPFSR